MSSAASVAPAGKILCAGRVYCDLVFTGAPSLPTLGTETFAQDLSLHAGGGAAITAATFSVLGWSSALFTTLPASPFDGIVLSDLAAFDIDLAPCGVGRDAQITVAIPAHDDRAFLTHRAGPALPGPIPQGPWRHLHIGELTTALEHPELIAEARKRDMTISLDCSWDDTVLSRGNDLAALLSNVDVFLPNTKELETLAAAGLSRTPSRLTVVKDGANGSRAFDGKTWITAPTATVQVTDATGAGDAFNAGFLAAWLDNAALSECLAQGNHCGTAAVQAKGGTGGLVALRRPTTAA